MNFIKSTIFLILAGVVNTNNGPDSTFCFTVATTKFRLLAVLGSPTSSLPHARKFVVIFFISPVGAVDRDSDFHLIDQGKVGYLYHLQILLFDLQDSSLSTNVSSSSYSLWLNLHLNSNNDADNDKATPAVMIKAYDMTYDTTIVFNVRSSFSINNDSDYFGRILLVLHHNPLIYNNPLLINDNNNNNEDYFGGRTSDNDFDLYFDTYMDVFDSADTDSSAVSVVEAATSSYDLSNNNPSSLTFNN